MTLQATSKQERLSGSVWWLPDVAGEGWEWASVDDAVSQSSFGGGTIRDGDAEAKDRHVLSSHQNDELDDPFAGGIKYLLTNRQEVET
jgi:hypothetical protein